MADDYAVRAAKGWFLQTQTALHNNHLKYPEENALWIAQQAALDDAVAKLASIIRSEVDELLHQHSWSCDDAECIAHH